MSAQKDLDNSKFKPPSPKFTTCVIKEPDGTEVLEFDFKDRALEAVFMHVLTGNQPAPAPPAPAANPNKQPTP